MFQIKITGLNEMYTVCYIQLVYTACHSQENLEEFEFMQSRCNIGLI
jgi:hypothetical protein